MCVIKVKTHRHSDGRVSQREEVRYCHEGQRRGSLCDHVLRKDKAPALRSESTNANPARHSSSADLITLGKDGKEHIYHRISRSESKRYSLADSVNSSRISSDAIPPPLSPSVREVRPSSSRPQRKARPSAIVVDTGASMTSTAPSLDGASPGPSSSVRLNFRQDFTKALPLGEATGKYHARVDSLADDDESELPLPPDESEQQINLGRERLEASEQHQQERVSQQVKIQEDEQARLECDRIAETERRHSARLSRQTEERDAEQARIERDRMADFDRRQKSRLDREAKARRDEKERREQARIAEFDRQKRVQASEAAAARARATAIAERAQRERHRKDTLASLEQDQEEAVHRRRVDAERAQMAHERSIADARMYAPITPQYYEPATSQCYEARSMPIPPRSITYVTSPRPTISARQLTNTHASTPTISARYPVTVHNNAYLPAPRDIVREHGDAVIAREQAATAQFPTQRLGASMPGRELSDDELDAVIDARMYQSSSGQQSREYREYERERQRRYERLQTYY